MHGLLGKMKMTGKIVNNKTKMIKIVFLSDGWGDWEYHIPRLSCLNPIAVKAETLSRTDFNDVTHIDIERGFWCLNEENNDIECEDYRAAFCCPTFQEGTCSEYGTTWQSWIDRDDPEGVGDVELRLYNSQNEVCDNAVGIKAQTVSGEIPEGTGLSFENFLGLDQLEVSILKPN